MARPLRLEFEDALYHVTSRGDRREAIFKDDEDRGCLLRVWAEALERFDARCFAYCLMGNHYHFVVQTRRPNLSRLMRHVNGVYTQRYNRRHRQVGHLFQGRFKAIVVDRDAYLLEVCRYVDLNPVRARMVRSPKDWRWSSYRAHVGLEAPPGWLDCEEINRQFAATAAVARRRYAEFVAQGRNVKLWEEALTGQIYLGDDDFVARLESAKRTDVRSREIPRAQRQPRARPLDWYIRSHHERDAGIVEAYLDGGHTQTAIARTVGLSVSRVSRVIARRQAKGKT